MKKTLLCFSIMLIFSLISCSVFDKLGNNSGTTNQDTNNTGNGNLIVAIDADTSRVLDVASAASYTITIKGTGIATPITGTATPGVSLSLSVPPGANRVIVVQGNDSTSAAIPGLKLYGYVTISAGLTSSATVSWASTPIGATLEALLGYSINLASVNLTTFVTWVNGLTAAQQKLVNVPSIATYYNTNSAWPTFGAAYIYTAASLSGNLYASDGTTLLTLGTYIVKVRDALSTANTSTTSGTYSVTNIVPSPSVARTIDVYSNGIRIASVTRTFANGEAATLNITTSVQSENGGVIIIINPGNSLIADASVDQYKAVNTAVNLDGTRSTGATTYQWTQVTGPVITITNPTSASASFTPTNVGYYKFVLTVGNGTDLQQDSVNIYVANPAQSPFVWQDLESATVGANSAQNGCGAYDFGFGVNGTSATTATWIVATPGANSTTKTSLLSYTLGTGNINSPAIAAYGSPVVNDGGANYLTATKDLSMYSGFTLYIKKGASDPTTDVFIKVYTSDIRSGSGNIPNDPHYYTITNVSSTYTQYKVKWGQLVADGWSGHHIDFDPAKVNKIEIGVKNTTGSTVTGSINIDELRAIVDIP